MKSKMYWFKAKRYGWGWGFPQTWQGWVVLLMYVFFLVWDFMRIDRNSHSVSDTLLNFFVPFVIATGILIFICYKTGEKPKWRWGGK